MKNGIKGYFRKVQKKERLKGVAVGATVGAVVGVVAGCLLNDDEKREKIKQGTKKVAKEAEKLACEAKKIVINKASHCCDGKRYKREILEVYPDEE